ncbi:MAG: glycosyltransferase [Acidimicrobiia bacterium]|nr:glycosyltransferase [Acidimicrobiia bacterium]
MNGTDIAVVIPTQNRWDVLARTIAGLRQQTTSGFEIVVVVDEGAQLPDFLDGVHVVYRNRRGVGSARNDGVRATDKDIVMFLGDDTIPEPTLLERHLALHRRHPEVEVGVLGAVPWHPEVARGRLQRWLNWSGTQFDYHTIQGDEAGWGRLYSSNVSLKRTLFQKVGGFDEEFMFGYEDIELGLRLHEAGLRLLYEPEARVWHVHRYEWPAIERRFRLVGGGEYLMVRKHPDFPPFFLRKLSSHRPVAPFSPWPWVVDYVPDRFPGLRRNTERRADAWYSKQLAAPFIAGWLAAEELEEEQLAVDRYDNVASERLAEQRWLGEILPLVKRGASILAIGCSPTIGRELVGAGYQVTFVVADDEAAAGVERRLEKYGISAPVIQIADLPDSAAFDVALAFRMDRVANGSDLLDAAERHAAVVAASYGDGSAGMTRDQVVGRAEGRKILVQLQDGDGTALFVYEGDRPRSGVGRPAHGELREAMARLAAERFGRRRPWVPPLRRRVDS